MVTTAVIYSLHFWWLFLTERSAYNYMFININTNPPKCYEWSWWLAREPVKPAVQHPRHMRASAFYLAAEGPKWVRPERTLTDGQRRCCTSWVAFQKCHKSGLSLRSFRHKSGLDILTAGAPRWGFLEQSRDGSLSGLNAAAGLHLCIPTSRGKKLQFLVSVHVFS